MSRESTFLVAAAITLFVSLMVVVVFWSTLKRAVGIRTTPDSPAPFWIRYWSVILVLVPLMVLFLGRNVARREDPTFFQVVDLVGLAFAALFAALVPVGIGAAILLQSLSRAIYVSPEQADELGRLIAKVEQMRARELVHRMSSREERIEA
jgi:divalent metal cation (Fe/Co/Zn/Cd) transporter